MKSSTSYIVFNIWLAAATVVAMMVHPLAGAGVLTVGIIMTVVAALEEEHRERRAKESPLDPPQQ